MGVHLVTGRVTKHMFEDVLSKIRNRLSAKTLALLKLLSSFPPLLFNSRRFESSDIFIHDIDLIRYHRDGIHPIEFRGERFIIYYGIKSRIIVK